MARWPLLLAALLLGAAVTAAPPARAGEGDEAAVRAVILAQMEAFKRDDGEAAFAFAAPRIKQIFPTAEIFMEMVRSDYDPVYRPGHVEFRGARGGERDFVQQVYIVGRDGRAVLAVYTLERAAGADWLITGCFLTEPPPEDEPI